MKPPTMTRPMSAKLRPTDKPTIVDVEPVPATSAAPWTSDEGFGNEVDVSGGCRTRETLETFGATFGS